MPDVDERHTLLFSATMPDNRQKLAKQFLRPEYLFIEVGIVGGACQGKDCDFPNGKYVWKLWSRIYSTFNIYVVFSKSAQNSSKIRKFQMLYKRSFESKTTKPSKVINWRSLLPASPRQTNELWSLSKQNARLILLRVCWARPIYRLRLFMVDGKFDSFCSVELL